MDEVPRQGSNLGVPTGCSMREQSGCLSVCDGVSSVLALQTSESAWTARRVIRVNEEVYQRLRAAFRSCSRYVYSHIKTTAKDGEVTDQANHTMPSVGSVPAIRT